MRKKAILLASFAVALVMAMGVTPAWGYFTDWTEANGGLVVNVTPEPTMYEWYGESTKHLVVANSAQGATTPIFTRARVLASSNLTINPPKGDGWTGPIADENGVDWYYYGTSQNALTEIAPGKSSNELEVKITFPRLKSETQPDGAAYGDQYNVIVYYEATAVEYRTDSEGNTTTFADWTRAQSGQNDQGGN